MKAFFTQWDGRDMKEQSSRRLMKQFFKNLRCSAAEITCNTHYLYETGFVPKRRADAHEARRSTPSPQIQDIAEGDLVDIQEEVDIGEESDAGDADDEISYDDNAGDETADHRHLSEDDDARPSGMYSPAPPQTPVGPSAPIFLEELRHQPLKPSEVMVMEARVAGVPHPQSKTGNLSRTIGE
ncbi:hypothetical protein TELCIR_09537 [Teladorsagia circumcincta]|uniref:Uncharacterized protein n=1 Tax=Teladorsagia circumcincta TaxID=45464 RepID=A0A2G9UEK8_TELCI|nr:hypothetical protein TELCIR_09537 [Teladorsagia circumcincta]